MYKQCRTCLSVAENTTQLHDTISIKDTEIKLSDVIVQCASVQISDSDDLPKQICDGCVDKASLSYTFKKICEESQKILLLKVIKIEIEPELLTNDECDNDSVASDSDDNIVLSKLILQRPSKNGNSKYTRHKTIVKSENSDEVDKQFQCEFCHNWYSFRQSLNRHIKKHHSAEYAKKKNYIRSGDIKIDSESNKLQCQFCLNVYGYRQSLLKHIKKVHGEDSIQGMRKGQSDNLLDDHDSNYKCETEETDCKNEENEKLLISYNNSCTECCEKFSTDVLLKEHELIHETFICRICNREFNKATYLKLHLKTHNSFDYLTYFNFTTNNYYSDDIIYKEELLDSTEIRPIQTAYECNKCDLIFPTNGQLQIHKTCHPPYICQHCGVIFNHGNTLENHLRQYHAKGTIIHKPCVECGKIFDDAELLEEHYATHKRFWCRKCSKPFGTSSRLCDHVLHFCKPDSDDLDRVYRCTICCNERFSSRELFIQHNKEHTDQCCQYCGLKLSQNGQRKHLEKHTSDIGFSCLVCNRKCGNPKELEEHVSTHDVFTCGDCSETSESLEELRAHRFGKSCAKSKDCRECGLSFEDCQELKKHHSKHSEEVFVTMYGKKSGQVKRNSVHLLENHSESDEESSNLLRSEPSEKISRRRKSKSKNFKSEAISGSNDVFKCEHCPKEFLLLKYLKRHRLVHLKKRGKCPYCDFVGTSTAQLARHMHGEHGNYKNRFCNICGKGFFTQRTLNSHMTTHNNDKNHVCEICGRGYKNGTNLKIHMRIHTGEKPYKCEICGKSYTQHSTLTMHMVFHTDKRDHVCDLCGQGFHLRGAMLHHMRMHTAERKYECKVCGKRFKHGSRLAKHTIIHTGEKNYVCNVCGKAFNTSSSLKVHTKIHTGEKPHACTLCDKRFIQAHVLRSHMNTHRDVVK